MVVQKASSKVASERWQKIFNCLVNRLQTQQTQLETLIKERKLFEDRIQIQYDRWVSDVRLLEGEISQMKSELTEAQLRQLLEVEKKELMVALKQRESQLHKLKFERAESDLEDFKLCFDYLTKKCSDQCGKSGGKRKGSERDNTTDVSTLISERDFVWNQLKVMGDIYDKKLTDKNTEVEKANEKIKELLSTSEQLHSSKSEKDETILKLKANLANLEADTDKSNREISRLSKELESLRNSKGTLVTPVLRRRNTEGSSQSTENKRSARGRKPVPKKESARSEASDIVNKESRGSRRRAVGASSVSETPSLFSSTFKVPKLKRCSSRLAKLE